MRISASLTKRLQTYLQEQIALGQLQPAQQLLEELQRSRETSQRWLNWSIFKLASFLGLLYLIAVSVQLIERRIEQEEIILFTIILLFNSGLFERLQEVVINRGGISFRVLQEEVEAVKNRVESQRADLDAHGGAIQNLVTAPIQEIESLQTDELNGVHREWLENLINEYEWKHLLRLHNCEVTGEEFFYRKRYNFEVELRRLRTLGLIENRPGKTLSGMSETGDLTEYIRLTEKGKKYIHLRRGLHMDGSAAPS